MPVRSRPRPARLIVCLAASLAIVASACSPSTPAAMVARVTPEGLRVHLVALDAIAREHGGNRAVGSPGFDASAEYAEKELAGFGYDVVRQEFEVPVFRDPGGNELAVLGGAQREFEDGYDFLSFAYSVPGTAQGPLISITAPCEPAAFDAVTPGSIVLVRPSETCGFDIRQPAEAGALAVIMGVPSPSGALARYSLPEGMLAIPALIASADTATALETSAGSRVRVRVTGETHRVTTHNILADLPGSSPDRVVMFGAHLDSAIEGPGIDDDGTGVAAVLEVARALSGSHPIATVRFALWSSEELGLLGAQHYTDTLSTAESRRIDVYLNADMLGAKNGIRAFYGGTAELSRTIKVERLLLAYFKERGLANEAAPQVLERTDALVFSSAGIAAAGLISWDLGIKSAAQVERYGGTVGQPDDACYHLACDDIANVDLRLLGELSAALASAVIDLAYYPPAPLPS